MIRAAIVGIGRWGRTLVGAVQGHSTAFRFTAGHTRTAARAEAFCAEHGIALKDSLDAILADPEIDAVVFATPHSEHGKQVERAAAAGKHVFMEKPFTLDRASAARALDAVARAGIVLGVAYPRRFHPAMQELKARIGDGRLGTIAHCSAEQNGPADGVGEAPLADVGDIVARAEQPAAADVDGGRRQRRLGVEPVGQFVEQPARDQVALGRVDEAEVEDVDEQPVAWVSVPTGTRLRASDANVLTSRTKYSLATIP